MKHNRKMRRWKLRAEKQGISFTDYAVKQFVKEFYAADRNMHSSSS